MKKNALVLGMAAVLGISHQASAAELIGFDVSGWMTVISPHEEILVNSDYSGPPMYGRRTPISGVLNFDAQAGAGTGLISPFSFFGGGYVEALSFSLQAIGDGFGGTGSLVLGNMTMDWNGNTGIPISLVYDAAGLFSALGGGLHTGDSILGGVAAATEDYDFLFGKTTYTLPMGPGPLVTTTWNTTAIGTPELGTDPSGTLPLVDDGIGGSPALAGPFPGFNFNFDFTGFTVNEIIVIEECPPICDDPSPVPLPATIWLLGSGLLGLLGYSRKAAGQRAPFA